MDLKFLETLYNDIIFKDVVKRWKIRNIELLEELADYLINNFSFYYTITRIKKSLGFKSKETIKNYIKYLEEAYLFFSLNNFSFKFKELIKSPRKLYVIDTGIINAKIHKLSENMSKLMDNVVFLDLRRRYKENKEIFYYKTEEGYEIDFLIKKGNQIKELIQVTYANNWDEIDHREIRGLLHANEIFKSDKPELIIITWDYEDEKIIQWWGKKGRIKFIPLWKWLLNL